MSGRQGAKCIACDAVVRKDHVKAEGIAGRMGAALMAVAAEGRRQRIYLAPTAGAQEPLRSSRPTDVPDQELGHDPRDLVDTTIWTDQVFRPFYEPPAPGTDDI